MRYVLENIYITFTDEFEDILTGDLAREIFKKIKVDKYKHELISLVSKWDLEIKKNTEIAYPYLITDAFYFSFAELLGR